MDVAIGKGVARRVLFKALLSFVGVSPDVAIVGPESMKCEIMAERPYRMFLPLLIDLLTILLMILLMLQVREVRFGQ